jgi:hypothetical protein
MPFPWQGLGALASGAYNGVRERARPEKRHGCAPESDNIGENAAGGLSQHPHVCRRRIQGGAVVLADNCWKVTDRERARQIPLPIIP